MMLKTDIKQILLVFIAFMSPLNGHIETLGGDDVDIKNLNQEVLFVSLGSYCAPASLSRNCGHRKAAFPFDWNISMDGEKLIELLGDGFLNFLNEDYLVPFGSAALINTYYHLEFVHDGSWDKENYSHYMSILQSKYKRRIERFKQLKEFRGKVFFMRAAYIYSNVDPNRYYKFKENIEISEEYSLRLYNTLKKLFPDLNFTLIIINNHENEAVIEEKKLNDHLMMVRAPALNEPLMIASYNVFFNHLLSQPK